MRNIETFPSKYCTYLYLLLVERKVAAEFYHNIDMDIEQQALIGLVKMTYFHRYFQTIDGALVAFFSKIWESIRIRNVLKLFWRLKKVKSIVLGFDFVQLSIIYSERV